jgi:hypothetical protein
MNTSAVRHDSYQDFVARQSDHEGQFVEGFGKSSGRRNVDSEIVEASAEVLDEGMASDDDPGGTVSLQSWYGVGAAAEPAVVSPCAEAPSPGDGEPKAPRPLPR